MYDMTKRRGRHSKEETTQVLVTASLKLIAEYGWDKFSIRKLAATCEMSPSNVIYHFENNETLILALLNKISENNYQIVSKAIKEKMNALEVLTTYFEKNIEWAEKFPEEAQIILLIYSRAGFDKDFSKICNLMIERAQGRISQILKKGVDEGLFKPKRSIEELATYLHQMILGVCIYRVGTRVSKKKYSDNFQDSFRSLLNC